MKTLAARFRWNHHWFWIAVVIAITYAPLICARYGFGDDFALLLSDQQDLASSYLIDGRPFFSLAQIWIHDSIDSISDLSWLRGLACLAAIGCSIFFFELSRRAGATDSERMGLAIALGLLPSMHAYVAQAIFWLASCAALLVFFATFLIVRLTRPQPLARRIRILCWVIAQSMMLIASATYQPVLSWFWVGVFVLLLDRRFLDDGEYRKQIYRVIALGFVSFVLCFIAFKFYFILFESGMKQRTRLSQNPIEKIYWFARIQLPLALNYWHLVTVASRTVPLAIASTSALLITAGYVVNCRRALSDRSASVVTAFGNRPITIRTILLLGIGLLTHIHWLAIADCPQSYRIIAPLGVTAFIAICWSVGQLVDAWASAEKRTIIRQCLTTGVMLFAVVVSQHYSIKYWIMPHETAIRYLTASIRKNVTSQTEHLHLIRQSREDGFVRETFIESHGSPATEREWMVKDLAVYALKESGIKHRIQEITHSSAAGEIPEADNMVVIDMRDLANFRIQ